VYNDANDLSSAFLNDATDPFDTFTGTKDGFVGVHDAPNLFARAEAQLAEDGVSGNQYHISFNIDLNVSFVADKMFLALKAADGTTTTSTATYDVVNGFNSVTLEANATSRFIHFAFSIDDTVTYTVSDFKVSRIERNGFVPTWYDQSTSGNNCTQSSASLQPFIVSNGGFCGVFMAEIVGGSEPNARHLRIDDIQTTDLGNNFGLIWVGKVDDTYSTTHFTTLVGANRNIVTQNQGTVGLNLKLASDEFQLKNETTGSAGVSSGNLAITYTSGDRVSVAGTCVGPDGDGDHTLKAYVNGATPVSNNDTLVLTDSSDDLRIMASNFSNTVRRDRSTIGKVDEVIIFASNIEPDMEEVRAEINNHYNIY